MAVKKSTAKTAAKAAPAKKARCCGKSAPKKDVMKKGEKLECRTCGLIVSVDEVCGCMDLTHVTCCGKPMKSKK